MNTTGVKQNFFSDDAIDVAALFGHLIANKWLILIVTFITLTVGYFYAKNQTPQYASDVLLQVDTARSGAIRGGLAEQLAFSGGSVTGNQVATQVSLIQSRFILEPVINDLGLDISVMPIKHYFWQEFFTKDVKQRVTIETFDVPHNKLNKSYEIYIDSPNHIIMYDVNKKIILQGDVGKLLTDSTQQVRFLLRGLDLSVGARFSVVKQSKANVIQSLIKRISIDEVGGNKIQGTGILTVKLVGEDSKQVIKTLNTIAKITRDQDAKKKAQEASQTLNFLHKQLPITKGQLEKAEFKLNNYRSKSGKIDIKLQTQFLLNQLSDLDKKLNELSINKIDMLQRYTKNHPAFIALNNQIHALRSQRSKLEQVLKTLPASDQIAVNLLRDVTVKKTLYLILLNKIQELQVVKAGTISGISILSKATIPDSPLPGKRRAIYLSSLLLGLMLSFAYVFGYRWFIPKVDDPHWCEKRFNLPSLAIIPYCKEQTLSALSLDKSKQIPLLALTNPRNLSIESLRSLRTSLQVSLVNASNNIVSILGVAPGVGKSFISVNLAYLLSTAGKKVLLIDADLRRGTVHKYINIPPSPGLADVLNDQVKIEDALVCNLNENLTCLARGTYPDDPSELLMSTKFKSLLHDLSSQYDVVVIDTAPILLVTDAVLVGGISATNYIVFGAGAHQPHEIEVALKRLSGSGVNLHGYIFNFHKSQLRKMSYGQYYNYNYSYYYDDSMKNPT